MTEFRRVVFDICEHMPGAVSHVGDEVEVMVMIPANTHVTVVYRGESQVSVTNKVTYLCRGEKSRFSALNGGEFAKATDVTVFTTIGGLVYTGNELYSAKELGYV